MERDIEVNEYLISNGWVVLRFWSAEIEKNLDECIQKIVFEIKNKTYDH